jgi:MFS family permease
MSIKLLLILNKAFINIYSPVWVDQYGPRNKKTIMMSILLAATPLGIVLGYSITMLITRAEVSWRVSFILQGVLFGVFVVSIIFIPGNYFSTSLKCMNPPDYHLENMKKEDEKKLKKSRGTIKIADKKKDDDVISLFQYKIDKKSKILNFWKDLCTLIRVKVNITYFKKFLIGIHVVRMFLFYVANNKHRHSVLDHRLFKKSFDYRRNFNFRSLRCNMCNSAYSRYYTRRLHSGEIRWI